MNPHLQTQEVKQLNFFSRNTIKNNKRSIIRILETKLGRKPK